MSLRGLAESDSTTVMDMDGDCISLISPSGDTYTLRGQYIRRGVDISPEGVPVPANVSAFAVSLSKLATLGLSNCEDLKTEGWIISSNDVTGALVKTKVYNVLLDRTLGRAHIFGRV